MIELDRGTIFCASVIKPITQLIEDDSDYYECRTSKLTNVPWD